MVLPQGILLCQTFQVVFASHPYAVSLLPRGDCPLCCAINLEEDIIFMTHRLVGEPLRAGVSAGAPGVDPSKPTVLYIHGFTEQASSPSATTVRRAYFVAGRDVNFLSMDWARMCSFPWYAEAVRNVPVAGRYLARFLERLFQDGVDPSNTHLVGFSLGAEVAGFAGKSLDKDRYRLGRITGLDPAFPLFRWTGSEGHLSAADAAFVDVIHTDGGEWGVLAPIGHADFYPNGGRPPQPGCSLSALHAKGLFPHEFIACSHSRAWLYFAESVLRPEAFAALRCRGELDFRSGECVRQAARLLRSLRSSNDTGVVEDVVVPMGDRAPPSCRGKYFLETRDEFPYAKGLDEGLYEVLDSARSASALASALASAVQES